MDWGFYIHSAGWCAVNSGNGIPVSYTCLNMILSDLSKVGITPEDTIIIGVDWHGEDYSSWRKQFSTEYKVGRQKLPPDIYQSCNKLAEDIEKSTSFHVIKLEHLEFDDIAAIATKYYTSMGYEVIIVSSDCDLEFMWYYDNVKIFSPHKKSKCYKIKPKNYNYYNVLAGKINKEKKDQVSSECLSPEEYDRRKLIMDLIELPEWVKESVETKLKTLEYKEGNINWFPSKKLLIKYNNLFNDQSKIITYEDTLKKIERKQIRKKNKKLKEKEKDESIYCKV